MGAPVQVPLGDGFYVSDNLPLSNQQLFNAYVDLPQAPALSDAILKGTPGLTQLITSGVTNQINRGAHVKEGIPYFLNGETLYRLNKSSVGALSLTALGTIPGSSRCSFADNGTQLMVQVPGGEGYIINEAASTVFQQITDTDFKANGNPQYVVFLDSFFIVTTDTKKIIKSASNNGLSWAALDFVSAEADPDAIVAPIVNQNRLFIAGTETIEVFENLGSSGFPFQRISGFIIPKGCFAAASLVNINDSFMFIGGGLNESPAIWTLAGSSAQKVSTTAIDAKLQSFSKADIAKAFAFSYAQQGAYFVEFTLPSVTFVYDAVTSKWHERGSQIINTKRQSINVRHRVNSLVTAYGNVICGDSQDGRLGSLSMDTYKEYDRAILRRFSLQPLAAMGDSFSVNSVELTMESGVGNFVQPDPEIRLSASKNGKVFSDPITRYVGKTGNYGARQVWRRLGRFPRFCVLLFEFSDPCKFRALKLRVNVKQGSQRGR